MLLSTAAAEAAFGAQLSAASFYVPQLGTIFEAIRHLYDSEQPIDVTTVAATLKGRLTEVGGRKRLLELHAGTPSSANAAGYARIVAELHHARRILVAATDVTEQLYNGYTNETLASAIRSFQDVATAPEALTIGASALDFIDLTALLTGSAPDVSPYWLRRGDGQALIYPGRINDFHAEPSIGKTWLACFLTKEVLDAGGNVVYFDYEDTQVGTVGRILNLDVAADVLMPTANRFRYANPSGSFGAAEGAELRRTLDELVPDVVIIDGVAEALVRDGLDENSNSDYLAWLERFPRPIADTGAAVVLLDHMKKDSKDRARGARGAGAKLGGISGASYEIKLSSAYSRHTAGKLRLVIAKDRNGQVGAIGATAAIVNITPTATAVAITLEAPKEGGGDWRPTKLMEHLSSTLHNAVSDLEKALLLSAVKGQRAHKTQALAMLVAEGYAEELPTKRYRSVKPFLAAKDDAPPTDENVPDNVLDFPHKPDPDEPF